tara:strand:+ start:2428 stop:4548 length:2121 start_codon:yes stop_codon:yes gene_type:complete
MPLINFQTDFTSLPWGRDRRNSDDSRQPYVTKDIPQGDDNLPVRSGPDFIIRGGLKAVSNALNDVSRLAQMFVDTKNPSAGLGFIVKQNILSRTSVKSQSSYGLGYATGPLNQGIYTPLSTLGQALGNGLGVHLNLLGLDPTSPMSGIIEGGLFPGAGLNTYFSVLKNNKSSVLQGDALEESNRLVALKTNIDDNTGVSNFNSVKNYNINPESTPGSNVMISYGGGPGSILGIGSTRIRFADQRTGAQNNTSITNPGQFYRGGVEYRSYQTEDLSNFTYQLSIPTSATSRYGQLYLTSNPDFKYQKNREFLFNDVNGPAILKGINGPYQTFNYKVDGLVNEINTFTDDETGEVTTFNTQKFIVNHDVLYKNNSRTYSQPQLIGKKNVIEGGQAGLYPEDFRKELYDVNGVNLEDTKESSVISLSPSYRNKNVDERLNQGSPGKRGGRLRGDNATTQKNVWNYGLPANELEALDKITAMPMYTGTGPDTNQPINDLVKFRIAAINNDGTDGQAVYMHFRAFLDNMSDNYEANWNSIQYVGRGEQLYNYGGFGRTISMGFTVAAQSKAELIPMYKKLNYLASTLAPDYTAAGFMRGNIVRLTVGGYLYEQPGFITSLTYDIPESSPWEIAIDAEGGSDGSVKELPHIIKVSGFSFTPIHTFLPQKPNNPNNPNSKFIALSNGVNTNYNDDYRTYQPTAGSGGDNQDQT